MSVFIATELSKLFETDVEIGRIDIGLLNRIIIDDLRIEDRCGAEMINITRLSAKFDIASLFKGKISISSVQLFGFNIELYKATATDTLNAQFLLDSFASQDTIKKENTLDLRVNSLLVRRGKLSYHVHDAPETPGRFNDKHIQLQNIIATVSLKTLNKDSVNVVMKRVAFDDNSSGFSLKKMGMKWVGNQERSIIDNFSIELPQTVIKMDTLQMAYDGWQSFDHFTREVYFSCRSLQSQITLKDIASFAPSLSHFAEPINLDMRMEGTVDQLICHHLEIAATQRQLFLQGEAVLQDLSHPHNAYIDGELSECVATQQGMHFLVRNLSPGRSELPPLLERLGHVSFRGEVAGYFTDLVTYGILNTDLGSIKMDMKLGTDKSSGAFSYLGGIQTADYRLGTLLDNRQLGAVTFNLDVHGKHMVGHLPDIDMKGLISSIEYSNYRYENITLNGAYKQGGFYGKAVLNDPNGSIYLDGDLNVKAKIPIFNFQAVLQNVRPNDLHLTTDYPDAALSLKLRSNFTGGNIDEMMGEINLDSLVFTSPEKDYMLSNLNVRATGQNGEKHLRVTSDFLQADIEGKFQYHTLLASIMNVLRKYVPSLVLPFGRPIEIHNNFRFDIQVYNTDILSALFHIPLYVYAPSTLKGYFNDRLQRVHVEGYFPRFQYKNDYIESAMLLLENPADHIRTQIRLTNRKKSGNINLSVKATAGDDRISTTLNWGNSGTATYSGQLAAVATFLRTAGKRSMLKALIDVQPTDVILNDMLWKIAPAKISVDSGRVSIDHFQFSREDRYLRIDGAISDQAKDSLKIELKDINMGYVFNIANISEDVDFEGDATGIVYASSALKNPVMNTQLFVKNLSLNQGRLGDADIYGEWDHKNRGIRLDASIQDMAATPSRVKGVIYPLKPESGLDLNIEANELDLKFLEFYISPIVKDIQGRGTGHVHLYGKFKGLNLDGAVMADASMGFDILNTRFAVKDTIRMAPTGITFRQVNIYDTEGHAGKLNGYLNFRHFKDMNYRFEIQADNMLVMNTKEAADMPFYGTIYGTGTVVLAGNAVQGLDANIALTTNRNSVFTYINGNVASATSNQFIKFVDNTPRRTMQDSVQIKSHYEELERRQLEAEEKQETDIRLNILVDATPDATVRIIMDPLAGDYISSKGTGNIRAEFYNKGDVRMFGSYQISQGIYKFSLQEVIRKDFVIKDGSSITFNGAPLNANLDIQASYTVNSASLNDLIPEESATVIQQPNVKVNCMMNLSGILLRPAIKLGIELPNERDEVQTLVRNYISTDEQMNMQILYLLGIGKFYTEDTRNNNQSSSVMSSVLSSTLSGQLNNALSQVFETNNWNIGTSLSTGERGWTDVEGVLSGQLLNNRLLINGNFGYRENPLTTTNFVGDFEAEWLINRSGDIRLKAYNETNDRYYTRTNLNTQGVGIMYKKDFNKWSDLFFWKKWRLRKRKSVHVEEQESESAGKNEAKSAIKRKQGERL